MNHDWHGEWLSSTKKLFINCVMKILIEFEKEEEKKKGLIFAIKYSIIIIESGKEI